MKRVLLIGLLLCPVLLSLVACSLFAAWDTPQERQPYDYDLAEYITLGDWRGLTLTQSEITPTEAELTEQYESDFALLMQLTDRQAELGDTVHLTYTAVFEGEEYDDDTEAGFRITLGENALGIPGFDEGLIGATPGDTVSLDLVFPADYGENPDYAGKEVSFLVDLHYICLPLPELTDEVVAAYTDYESAEEYLEETRAMLEDIKKIDALWQKVLSASRVIQYPEAEYESYYTEYLEAYRELAAGYNMTLSEMITESGSTMDAFYDEADATVKNYLKEDLIVYTIARAEGLTLSEEDYQEELSAYFETVSSYYLSAELLEESVGRETLTQQFLSNKVLDLIVNTAIVLEG